MKRTNARFAALLLAVVMLLAMTGCGNGGESGTSAPAETVPPTMETDPPETDMSDPETEQPGESAAVTEPEETPAVLDISDRSEIKAELIEAIKEKRQPRTMNIAAVSFGEHPELDVKNMYYDIQSENREYVYAYDLTASISDGILNVEISYMPYKTGNFPEGFEGEEISSLDELIQAASAHIGEDTVNIRITNTELTPDDMNHALGQIGGVYIFCSINNDATAIRYSRYTEFSMEECLAYISECDSMAENIVREYTAPDMSDREKAEALYGYLTANVKYDFRYYSDKASMPFHSQTAYGALHDDLAICGGYSNALKLLFEKAGIKCFNVLGISNNENHMWSIALIDGEWLYFDSTADRGVTAGNWRFFGVDAEGLVNHSFDKQVVDTLTGR